MLTHAPILSNTALRIPTRKTSGEGTNFCKILGFHGGVYEECLLLGYKNPFRTSQ
jgi:hypothetical protein